MDFHAFMYVTIGRRHELERGMAGKDPVLYQRMLDEIAEYARACDATGWSGIGIPEHHHGQGILAPDRCLKTLELFAEKVIPRFR
jgi:alkanesulfonate monooxygenase SsuD/methylene tetrahydromethanopterin reductase-like flavin-dependent oxidoreductase (luciferase family)